MTAMGRGWQATGWLCCHFQHGLCLVYPSGPLLDSWHAQVLPTELNQGRVARSCEQCLMVSPHLRLEWPCSHNLCTDKTDGWTPLLGLENDLALPGAQVPPLWA